MHNESLCKCLKRDPHETKLPGFPVKQEYGAQSFQSLKLPASRSQWHVQWMVGASQCLLCLLYGHTCHLYRQKFAELKNSIAMSVLS